MHVSIWMENSIEFLRSPPRIIPQSTDVLPKFPLPFVPPSTPNCYLNLLTPSLNHQLHLLGGQGCMWEPRPSQVGSWAQEFQHVLKAPSLGKWRWSWHGGQVMGSGCPCKVRNWVPYLEVYPFPYLARLKGSLGAKTGIPGEGWDH